MPRIRVNPSRNGRNAGYWRRPPHDPRGERGEMERAFEKEYGKERGERLYFATETQRSKERARERLRAERRERNHQEKALRKILKRQRRAREAGERAAAKERRHKNPWSEPRFGDRSRIWRRE